MRLEPGRKVRCGGAALGELADVVVDPRTRRITHVVVRPHAAPGLARLAPIDAIEPGEGDVLVLRGTPAAFEQLPQVSELAYLRLGEQPVDDPDWEIGVTTVLAMPTLASPGLDADLPFDDHIQLAYDRVPRGTVELAHDASVVDADGRRLGRVEGFEIAADGQITDLVVQHGHFWRRRTVTIPVEAIATVDNDLVRLARTSESPGS
ncbi:MAG TPA: PRC-barrel domain-containing protein [Solirubrobacteraceae bacterium]|jgi:sporulation protein YlmC with PRC-barrel domain|nr:PRC-barrel domain-containing protein [Solirubrobacteraceae bacterium]